MRVQSVLSWAALMEGTEQAAFRNVERLSVDLAGGNGAIHLPVIFGPADIYGQLASIDLKILVSGYPLDFELPGEHPHAQIRNLRDIDCDLEIVSWTMGDFELATVPIRFELNLDVPTVVTAAVAHPNLVVIGATNHNTT